MTLQSMTGFSRSTGQDAGFAWTWEGRSVNARSLDIRCRVPGGYEAVEQAIRAAAVKQFQRGNITLGLSLERVDQAQSRFRINRELLDQVQALHTELGDAVADTPPQIDGLLAIRGMLEPVVETEDLDDRAAREEAMIADGRLMLTALSDARCEEGRRLDAIMAEHLDVLADLTNAASACASAQPEAIRARLSALVSELLGTDASLPEERLAQEAAILVGKADIREELDRLTVHVAGARDLLAEELAVGRRLDFLCQELNREANTLCSKSADLELTRVGLAMKATIEQFREQVQNVE
ncbi:MAG: YicC family protein [Rhodospirillaceae bacterium]|nr:YicC family protein [Rhodospirillaceae bacterium]|tara:strand:+ start:16 stop:906 length:891 start_codon:yes stop_codon:yes gene_type:complete